jgi:hypothetical protein
MNDNQRKIIRAMRLVSFPIALLMLGAFAWEAFSGRDSNLTARTFDFLGVIGSPLLIGAALFFWVIFAALLIEFLKRELPGGADRAPLGNVMLSIRRPMLVVRVLQPLAALSVMIGMNLIVFAPAALDIQLGGAGPAMHLLFWLFYGISLFMAVVLVLRAIRNRPYFVLSDRGFLYAPGDLSPGIVLWQDIVGLKEADLIYGRNSYAGSRLRRTLIVTLKDPEKYTSRFNPLLRQIYIQLIKAIRFQVAGSGDLVIAADDFGRRYDEVRALMSRQVSKAGGEVSIP